MRRLSPFFLALFSLALAGCGSLLESDAPADSTWWLEPANLEADAFDGPRPLAIALDVVPGLDTDRMLNLDDRARLNEYAGARWPDHLPEVLTSHVARSLERAGWGPVREADYAREGECSLRLEVRAFHGRLDAEEVTRTVDVSLAGQLECDDGSTALSVSRSEPVARNRLADIVAAFQQALDSAVADLARHMSRAVADSGA